MEKNLSRAKDIHLSKYDVSGHRLGWVGGWVGVHGCPDSAGVVVAVPRLVALLRDRLSQQLEV